MQYYIKNNFYFDIDHANQLRITGPENHLLLGLTFPKELAVTIDSYAIHHDQLQVCLTIPVSELELSIPIVTDIRTLRSFTEPVTPKPLYNQLVAANIADVTPRIINSNENKDTTNFIFTNQYYDLDQQLLSYGAELVFSKEYDVILNGTVLQIKARSTTTIALTINTISTIAITKRINPDIFKEIKQITNPNIHSFVRDLYVQTQEHIEHLIANNKTSSFEYGTIFPRDWIESADLGKGDLKQEIVDYMYEQSMLNISDSGEGWHENIVGEYRTKVSDTSQHIDRKMIDIEPHYILGVEIVSKEFLTKEEHHTKFKKVANFIYNQATEHDYITFKRVQEADYYLVGNWRDSIKAFPSQKSPLAPYDVNCIFYPCALSLIQKYHDYFEIEDDEKLAALIKKWDKQKDKFRLYHHHNIIGYSLALHGKKNRPLAVAHLDESYDLFYGQPSLEEISSFATKIQDPDFFYTPVGPILVAADDEDLTTKEYHGKVIWPKQVAFSVAGLAKQYRRGQKENWPWPLLQHIRQAVIKTSEAFFKGVTDLGSVPELYYYDPQRNSARFYTDQEAIEGQMSLIQLWSAVGARRIIHEYLAITES